MDNVSAQQQAYLQHVELIQQHKAVEAHQRLMSQRQDSTAIPPSCSTLLLCVWCICADFAGVTL